MPKDKKHIMHILYLKHNPYFVTLSLYKIRSIMSSGFMEKSGFYLRFYALSGY